MKARPEPASAKPPGKSESGKTKLGKTELGKMVAKPTATRRCPICGKPAAIASDPFCSPRCRDVDLNRWLSGSYVIPGAENNDEDAE